MQPGPHIPATAWVGGPERPGATLSRIVRAGWLTQTQADAVQSWLQANAAQLVDHLVDQTGFGPGTMGWFTPPYGFGPGMWGHRFGPGRFRPWGHVAGNGEPVSCRQWAQQVRSLAR
jgi:hypothetical protein